MENPEDEYAIQKDVTRTFTNYPMQKCDDPEKAQSQNDESWNTKNGEDMLYNVLLAYANYDS